MNDGSKYPLEGAVALAACAHRQKSNRAGCSCGFAVWSGEHVAIAAYRAAVDYAEFCDREYGGRRDGGILRPYPDSTEAGA